MTQENRNSVIIWSKAVVHHPSISCSPFCHLYATLMGSSMQSQKQQAEIRQETHTPEIEMICLRLQILERACGWTWRWLLHSCLKHIKTAHPHSSSMCCCTHHQQHGCWFQRCKKVAAASFVAPVIWTHQASAVAAEANFLAGAIDRTADTTVLLSLLSVAAAAAASSSLGHVQRVSAHKQAILWMGSCAKRHRTQTLKRTAMSRELSYMKNEAVNTRPAMSRSTAKKGYSVWGMGLPIAVTKSACNPPCIPPIPSIPRAKNRRDCLKRLNPQQRASKTTQKICLNRLYTQEEEFSKTTEEIAWTEGTYHGERVLRERSPQRDNKEGCGERGATASAAVRFCGRQQ